MSAIAAVLSGSLNLNIHINVNAELRVDCSRPLHVNNFKVRIDVRNTIAPDKTAFANWQITSLGTETLSFSTKLGSAQSIGLPSGSSAQLRVTPGNGLLLTMTSPQSTLNAKVTASGNACNVTLGTALRGGFREYSLWSGSNYYYCSQPRVVKATCPLGDPDRHSQTCLPLKAKQRPPPRPAGALRS